jgi:hypothetical protein
MLQSTTNNYALRNNTCEADTFQAECLYKELHGCCRVTNRPNSLLQTVCFHTACNQQQLRRLKWFSLEGVCNHKKTRQVLSPIWRNSHKHPMPPPQEGKGLQASRIHA